MTRRFQLPAARIISLTVFAATFMLVGACSRDTATGQSPADQALPVSVKASGFTVSLTAVEATSERTVLTFRITDADLSATPAIDAYAGLTPLDLKLQGLAWDGPYIGSYHPVYDTLSTAQPPPIVAAEEVLQFGPVAKSSQPVSISFTRLRFMSPATDQPVALVDGDWTFQFAPDKVGELISTRLAVGASSAAQGITFLVDEVVLDRRQATVRYRIEASRPRDFEDTGIAARLSDGTLVVPDRANPVENGYLAVFPPLPVGQSITIALAPILIEESVPLALAFPVDGREVADGMPGDQIPVSASFGVAGERITVEGISLEEGGFSIRAVNRQPNQLGTILLRFPGKGSVNLTDNLGNSYTLNGASTNFGKSDPLTTWADGSSFSFAGTIPTEATLLTLRVDGYARQLRGPWTVTVDIPAE